MTCLRVLLSTFSDNPTFALLRYYFECLHFFIPPSNFLVFFFLFRGFSFLTVSPTISAVLSQSFGNSSLFTQLLPELCATSFLYFNHLIAAFTLLLFLTLKVMLQINFQCALATFSPLISNYKLTIPSDALFDSTNLFTCSSFKVTPTLFLFLSTPWRKAKERS